MSSKEEPAVDVRDVTKMFGDKIAVDRVSFSVPKSGVFGLIGPNGSGKTTTIRMIMNIFFPDLGEIVVLGSRGSRASRDQVSYLPEERGLYKTMKVRDQLRYYGMLKGASKKDVNAAIDVWLDRMGLSAYADKKIEALSKGMSQKVQFISAVVSNPDIIILDEPFSGLDPVNAEILESAVRDLAKKGKTIIFSTHDMNVAERLCERICMLFKGKKVLDGTIEEIKSAEDREANKRVRVRTEGGRALLEQLSGITSIEDRGAFHEVVVSGDAQDLLRELASRTSVQRFEIARPSLHEIFIRIARPTGDVYDHA